AHLVRAVVHAVPRADAAVVGHVVEALGAVRRRVDGAHVLAGRLLAVLAGDGLHRDLRVRRLVADEVAIEPDPVHLAAERDLHLADRGDVVLGLAGDDAGAAARARREVDDHAPLVPGRRA